MKEQNMDEHDKHEEAEKKTHKKNAKEEKLTYHYDSHRSRKSYSIRICREGISSEAPLCEGYSALRGDSGGSANAGMSTNEHSNGHRTVRRNSGTGETTHSIRSDNLTMKSRRDTSSHRIFFVRGSSCAPPSSDTYVTGKRWLPRDCYRESHSSCEPPIPSMHDRVHHLELSIPPRKRNGKMKKVQRRYTSQPNVSGRPQEITHAVRYPRSQLVHTDEKIKMKGRQKFTQWSQSHLCENGIVKCEKLFGLGKLKNLYKWSDDYHVHSSTRHATFHRDSNSFNMAKATKKKHTSNTVASIGRCTFKRKEEENDSPVPNNSLNNNPCGHKLFQVKFLCQAKGYDLKKISLVFNAKSINYVFHDSNNILCAFLTPGRSTKYFYNLDDIGNINSFHFMRGVTPSDAEYTVFIFINGSVVIWDNSPNCYRNDLFINKVIVFLNSYSDELLPVHVVQEDTMFYNECGGEEEKWHPPMFTPSGGLIPPSQGIFSSSGVGTPLISGGVIRLRSGSLEQKLIVSFALSQSIRLDVHEMLMDTTINKLFLISKQIATRGTCTISKQDISRMLDVYSSIINVNAVQDFLDVPEYFWHRVQYEHAWFEIYTYLEIPERIKILNKRYNYYKDFLKVIKTEVYNDKTFHTYRIIVLLLFIHVCALILNDMFFT
ncbi:conserved Plasmodium protein, unknown function [Plasmodium knowlesi strain H]|uniref:DUF155 domain-containing protein n=3 Tax=Plasmodium knowlesi TaxID=5850 RepID=A0A5K1VJI0_PLAKH|nr:conserved protein, unknown function [Plasmodium knowlesi strain H]OTN68191.1 Uncharacterized protein PKNOH_S03317900 [Plasmodium knowlesi]CAA9987081.1 conserved protein, unknown function [Plasmodium knowlesi strain H]SBO23809.1 conserved Plasmodium protein, unknown function [Plasmodium knowlesi strain H]SBO25562.1 conserved Plasmodium protein, unknown function [Plasmodium knowlesi strain H]VVS76555.1 conserved protein, unknown function [Plasmodium knowlesi strain H]|eukprot:XP_002261703.1 hypothetical protein, conserved in Plasmodium species [Plasmodium knowlesi strain H]